jgi:NADPH:quinone reductase-like Zn-dependent oxidoreductase
MGVEYSGVIEELGPEKGAELEEFKVGDEVFGLAYGGMYSLIAQQASSGGDGNPVLTGFCRGICGIYSRFEAHAHP